MQPLYYRNTPPTKVACCYSFNAYWTANVALHPYWFKQFGLDRMCRQDVCLSVWLKDHSHDLMFKVRVGVCVVCVVCVARACALACVCVSVQTTTRSKTPHAETPPLPPTTHAHTHKKKHTKVTDVCDPKDCPTPFDIKVEPYKGRYLWRMGTNDNPYYLPTGPVDMYFVKCWADGMPQPDMLGALPGPALQNSRHWMITNTEMQWKKNQEWARKHGQPTKPLGMLVRPEATQRWLADYRQSEWPAGSQYKVKAKYYKKC